MADTVPPDAPLPIHPHPSTRRPAPEPAGAAPPRPSLAQRMQPWVDILYKLLAAAVLAVALWRGLG